MGTQPMRRTDTGHRVAAPPALLIENDFFMAGELNAVLEDLGLEVRIIPTSDRALALTREMKFSVAIFGARSIGDADVRVAAQLRELNPGIPLLLLCARAFLDRLDHPGELARATHLDRPVRMSDVRRKVMESLGIADSDQSGTTIPG